MVCRNRDANTAWTSASDGTLEERYYVCQNWRGDVSALVTSARQLHEMNKYSPYGVPFGLPGGDTNSDGDNDTADATQIQTWIDMPAYDVRGDVDLDGDLDTTDKTLAQSGPINGSALGWAALSADAFKNRRSFVGYTSLGICLDARMRQFSPKHGAWLQRDPYLYADNLNLYQYVSSGPLVYADPFGLTQTAASYGPRGSDCNDQCASDKDCGGPEVTDMEFTAGLMSSGEIKQSQNAIKVLNWINTGGSAVGAGLSAGSKWIAGGQVLTGFLPSTGGYACNALDSLYSSGLKINRQLRLTVKATSCITEKCPNLDPNRTAAKTSRKVCGEPVSTTFTMSAPHGSWDIWTANLSNSCFVGRNTGNPLNPRGLESLARAVAKGANEVYDQKAFKKEKENQSE